MTTKQEDFWSTNFGEAYSDRNQHTVEALDAIYKETFGTTRGEMNSEFIPDDAKSFLEVGCNTGNILSSLQAQGHKNLNGIDIQEYAIQQAIELTSEINVLVGSAFNIPFEDNSFDLVFTSGVLIHIHPDDVAGVMREIARVSKKYIWGLEYYSPEREEINYRDKLGYCWKDNFPRLYQENVPGLKLIKEKHYKYLENDNVDSMFILKK